MALYLVVRHPENEQRWDNRWDRTKQLLVSSTTTPEIGILCEAALATGEVVFVHRTGWKKEPPTICCSVRMKRAAVSQDGRWHVDFGDPTPLNAVPPKPPRWGESYYNAAPISEK